MNMTQVLEHPPVPRLRKALVVSALAGLCLASFLAVASLIPAWSCEEEVAQASERHTPPHSTEPSAPARMVLPAQKQEASPSTQIAAKPFDKNLTQQLQTLGVQSLVSSSFGARWRLSNNGLPRNIRQVQEGYWVGSLPDASHIRELYARGVRLVISGSHLDRNVEEQIDALSMARVDIAFGSRFPSQEKIIQGTAGFEPSQIYIHCDHGGDRSGAILAYLLTTRHHWPVDQAFFAVSVPTKTNLSKVASLLRKRGVVFEDDETARFGGIYSGELNGGFGGLKVHGPAYENLVNTTLAAIEGAGVDLLAMRTDSPTQPR